MEKQIQLVSIACEDPDQFLIGRRAEAQRAELKLPLLLETVLINSTFQLELKHGAAFVSPTPSISWFCFKQS